MFKEFFIYGADILPLTASATGDEFQESAIKIAGDSHFEAVSTIFQATSTNLNMKMIHASSGEEIIRSGDARAVSSTALSGMLANGFKPYNFPIPYMCPADSELIVHAADKSNASNYFRLAIHGNKVYGGKAPYEHRKRREVGQLPFSMGSVAAYDTVTRTFVLDSAAGFLVSKLTGSATAACLISIRDIRPWSSGDVHFYNMFGNSQFGNKLTSKRWLPEKTVLTIKVKDLSGSANTVKISLQGERVFL